MNTNKTHRETKQKELIMLILGKTREHPTADWIYEQARQHMPHISKGTIYRNLAILLEEGKISELNLNGTVTRYEQKQMNHYHFRCEQCGKIIDLGNPVDTSLEKIIEQQTGFKVTHHQLEFRGLCKECQK
jgi:Fur family transcriptional regulator, peroxide stress response regulator